MPRYSKDDIAVATSVNLQEFLQFQGYELKRADNKSKKLEGYGGLYIFEKGYHHFSEQDSGNNIHFCRNFLGMEFQEAVKTLLDYQGYVPEMEHTPRPQYNYQQKPKTAPKTRNTEQFHQEIRQEQSFQGKMSQQNQRQAPPPEYVSPPPPVYREPPPEAYREPPLEAYGEPPPEAYREPPPEVYREPPPEAYREPPLEAYGEPPPEAYREPPPEAYREPPLEAYGEPPPEAYGEPPPEFFSEPPPEFFEPPPEFFTGENQDFYGELPLIDEEVPILPQKATREIEVEYDLPPMSEHDSHQQRQPPIQKPVTQQETRQPAPKTKAPQQEKKHFFPKQRQEAKQPTFRVPEPKYQIIRPYAKEPEPPKEEMVLPPRSADQHGYKSFLYLTEERCLDKDIVNDLMRSGQIFEASTQFQQYTFKNVAFVGMDKDNNPKHCALRSIGGKKFTQDVKNSDKAFGFCMKGRSSRVFVCEAPIDVISHATLTKMNGVDYTADTRIAMGGLSDNALKQFLADNPQIKEIVFAFDNDFDKVNKDGQPSNYGQNFAKKCAKIYAEQGYKTQIQTPKAKDFNEQLQKMVKPSVKQQINNLKTTPQPRSAPPSPTRKPDVR